MNVIPRDVLGPITYPDTGPASSSVRTEGGSDETRRPDLGEGGGWTEVRVLMRVCYVGGACGCDGD